MIICVIYHLSNGQHKTYLNDFHVFLAPLRCEALHAAELRLRVGVMHGGPGAADELARVQRARHGLDRQSFPQGATIARGIHHHGLRARIDLGLHHGDLQDVGHRGLLARRSGAGLWDQFGGGLPAAEDGCCVVGAAEGNLGDGGTLRDDWLL